MRHFLLFFSLCFYFSSVIAQSSLEVDPNDLYAGGDTRSLGNNCFRLTAAQYWEGGSVGYNPSVSLKEPFEMEMNIFFGCKDALGADGLVFIFYPGKIPTGYKGEGMGFGGLVPSLGIEIDTYQNPHRLDPPEDHVAMVMHGSVSHFEDFSEPVTIPNIEDCKEHLFRINWEPDKKWLSIMLDGKKVLAKKIDLVNYIFQGKDQVYWGVTAATGKKTNLHEICFEQLTFNTPQLGYSTKRDLINGEITDLPSITFPKRSPQLDEKLTSELDKFVQFLKENPKHTIQFYLHSNEGSSSEGEKKRSKQRGDAITAYLRKAGIPVDRISIQAMGNQFAKRNINGQEILRKGNWVQSYMFIPRV